MKRYILSLLAIACTVGFLAFTSTEELKQDCTWYVYDTAVTPEPSDFPVNATQAKTQNNYRVASGSDLDACSATLRLCAICAQPDPNNPGKPLITGQTIATEIDNYFAQPLATRTFSSPLVGLEKNTQ